MEENLADPPTIDLSLLRHNSAAKPLVINKFSEACRIYGFFHVINHGIGDSVMEEALNVNEKFFELPMAAKEDLMSDDIYKAVRFGKVEIGGFSRDFLKLYAYPLEHYAAASWPRFPPDYREKMAMYSTKVRKLCIELFEAIMEGLNLFEVDLEEKFNQGFQIIGVNCYPPCSGSNVKAGIPPHTDHSIITVLLQSAPGLQVIDRVDGSTWKNVPVPKGSLQVLVGDHMEVISNGLYKSVLHRAIPGCNNTRFSIASLHSLAMDEIVESIAKVENEENVRKYRGSSLRDFLKHHASRDTRGFIEVLKVDQVGS